MVAAQAFSALKLELSVRAKNGLDFIGVACIVWAGIVFVWTLPYSPARLGFITFFVGALVLAGLLFVSYRRHRQVYGATDAPNAVPALA